MKSLKFKLISLFIAKLCFTSMALGSNALFIKGVNNASSSYEISEIKNITFDGSGNMLIHKRDNTVSFGITGIANLFFGDANQSDVPDIQVPGMNIKVFPNPMINELQIRFEQLENKPADIQLIDINGRSVMHKRFLNIAGIYELDFDVSSLSKGIYLCRILIGEELITKKILKF